jgi:hypothetical protein
MAVAGTGMPPVAVLAVRAGPHHRLGPFFGRRQCITHASKLFRPLRPFRINSFSLGKLAPVFQKTVFLLACAVLLRRADGRAYVGDYGSIEEVLCATAVIWLAYLATVFVLGRLVARQIQSHCHPQLGGVSPVRRAFPRTEQFVSTADDPQARSPPFRGIGRPAEGFARFFSKVCLSAVLKFPNCSRWNFGRPAQSQGAIRPGGSPPVKMFHQRHVSQSVPSDF